MTVTRSQWRDATKRSRLKPTQRLVCWAMADYWPKTGSTLWCAMTALRRDTGLSMSTLYVQLGALQEKGWLVQVSPARQHYSPRYQPCIPPQDSDSRTPGEEEDPAQTSGSRNRDLQMPEPDLRCSDPKPHVNHTGHGNPAKEERKVLHSRSACTWCSGGGCPQCAPDEYGEP